MSGRSRSGILLPELGGSWLSAGHDHHNLAFAWGMAVLLSVLPTFSCFFFLVKTVCFHIGNYGAIPSGSKLASLTMQEEF